jgi:hypothetical protein
LREHLVRYGVWSESLESRLHVIEGDLTLPRLGLSAACIHAGRRASRRCLSRGGRRELGRKLWHTPTNERAWYGRSAATRVHRRPQARPFCVEHQRLSFDERAQTRE